MASKRRLRRLCEGKRSYADQYLALDALAEHRRKGVYDLHAYRCRLCRRWHLGHRPAEVQRIIDRRLGVRA